jgi:hypothetical protein
MKQKRFKEQSMKFIRDILTGADNETYAISRIIVLSGAIAFIGLAIYDVVIQGHRFDAQNYGIGFGGAMTGLCAGLSFGAKAEPPAKNGECK